MFRAAAAVFATAVALAAGVVNGVPEPGSAAAARELASAGPHCTPGDREFAGYEPADTTPESAARPAEPLPGAGFKDGTKPLAARERWSVVRCTPPAVDGRRLQQPSFARQIAAARDGTLSARSTGLPPPA